MADHRQNDGVADAALQYIIDNTDRQVAVSADPVNFAGVVGATLAASAMVGGDFSISAGVVSGRTLSWSRKTPITPTANGTATHVCFVDDTNSEIVLMWPISATGISTGTDIDFAEGQHEIRAPQGA